MKHPLTADRTKCIQYSFDVCKHLVSGIGNIRRVEGSLGWGQTDGSHHIGSSALTTSSLEHMLTDSQLTKYREKGYTLYPGLFTEKEVSVILSEIDSISAGNTLESHDRNRLEMEPRQQANGTLVRRIYDPCTHYPQFRTLSESEKLLNCVEKLLSPNLLFHYSKINMKLPAVGSPVEWHQDLTYYPLTNRDSVAVLIYLDHADRENGCLRVIPGLHLDPCLDHTLNGFFQGRITQPIDETFAELLEERAGSAVFVHSMTPHASVTNTSNRPRRTLILSYRAADAYPIYAGESTIRSEAHVRLVRGERLRQARFSMRDFPIPEQRRTTASLYELQELSHKEGNATS